MIVKGIEELLLDIPIPKYKGSHVHSIAADSSDLESGVDSTVPTTLPVASSTSEDTPVPGIPITSTANEKNMAFMTGSDPSITWGSGSQRYLYEDKLSRAQIATTSIFTYTKIN